MNQPLFKPDDAAAPDMMVKLIPAPVSVGTTISGYQGITIFATRCEHGQPMTAIGIVQPDGSVVGVLMSDERFDHFCLEVAPFVEAAAARQQAPAYWAGETVQ